MKVKIDTALLRRIIHDDFTKLLAVFFVYTVGLWFLLGQLELKDYLLGVSPDLPLWYGFLFVLAYVARGFFYFPSLYFLVAASLFFPFPESFVFYMLGVMLSGILSFQIGKALRANNFWPSLQKRIQKDDVEQKIEKNGFKAVFIFHVTGISLDLPNYLSGYLKLNFQKFLWTIFWANLITTSLYFVLFWMFDFRVLIGTIL